MEYTLLNNGVKMPMVGLGTFPLKGKPLQELIKQLLIWVILCTILLGYIKMREIYL